MKTQHAMSRGAQLTAIRTAVVVVSCLVVDAGLLAQGQPAPTPTTYELASIRPNTSGAVSGSVRPGIDGTFRATNVTLRELLTWAYSIPQERILGGPSWVQSARYDVLARAEAQGDWKPGQYQVRLRGLLADRFRLKAHTETRQVRVYALVRASNRNALPDATAEACEELDVQAAPQPPSPGQKPPCGRVFGANGRLRGFGVAISDLREALELVLQQPVVDQTGLLGRYDIQLSWSPEADRLSTSPSTADAPPIAAPEASLFTAIQEQLGLKLNAETGPAEVLVVDSVERPSEN